MGERGLHGCDVLACEEQLQEACAAPAVAKCNTSCVSAFVDLKGCETMFSDDSQLANRASKTAEITKALVDLKCDLTACMDEVASQCTPADGCDACIAGFSEAGGCVRIAENPTELLPQGCLVCAGAAWEHCTELAETACAACKDAVDTWELDSCTGEMQAPDQCQGCPEVVSSEIVSSHCTSLQEQDEDCHTTQEGEDCFAEVRWAMERGMKMHRDWYEDLDMSSSFEDFQAMLHDRKPDICKQPCKEVKSKSCHTASVGEECYRHTAWARDIGISLRPDIYPDDLSSESSMEDFQAWLHQIHHGGCQMPCEVPQ